MEALRDGELSYLNLEKELWLHLGQAIIVKLVIESATERKETVNRKWGRSLYYEMARTTRTKVVFVQGEDWGTRGGDLGGLYFTKSFWLGMDQPKLLHLVVSADNEPDDPFD